MQKKFSFEDLPVSIDALLLNTSRTCWTPDW